MPLIQLLYCSEHKFDLDALSSSGQINNILSVSQERNFNQQITGVLLVAGRGFVQMLEGERIAVLGLFNKIEQDKRHFNVMLLLVQEIAERHYASWSMACVQKTPMNAHLFGPYIEKEAFRADRSKGSSIVSLLGALSGLGLMKRFTAPVISQEPEALPSSKVSLEVCDTACDTRFFESEDAAAEFIAALKRSNPSFNLPFVIVQDSKETAQFSVKIMVGEIPSLSFEEAMD